LADRAVTGADAQFAVQPDAVCPDLAAAVDWALSGAGW